MSTLVVLSVSLLLYRLVGVAGVGLFATWLLSARAALATMFVFTAISHVAPMRKDLIAMVPPGLPRPDLLVFVTGIAELAGAVGLMFPPTRFWAACGLVTLMVVMLPANVSAARRGTRIRGRRATPLWFRVPMQALFIAWAWMVR
ncbi:MAG TPA: DoxX family protein [Vicinamibacterales bacterium]